MIRFPGLLAAVAALAVVTATSPVGAAARARAYYSSAQASAGAKDYAQHCAQCHGDKLEGVSGPALAGPAMHGSQAAGDIYHFMAQQMPAGAPGSLSPKTYAAIMAYLLKANGHPAGPIALTPGKAAAIKEKI